MMATPTQGERLAAIEAIMERMERTVDAIDRKVDRDVADLAAIKNRGAGLLVGVALAAGAAGSAATKMWQAITGG